MYTFNVRKVKFGLRMIIIVFDNKRLINYRFRFCFKSTLPTGSNAAPSQKSIKYNRIPRNYCFLPFFSRVYFMYVYAYVRSREYCIIEFRIILCSRPSLSKVHCTAENRIHAETYSVAALRR